VAMLSGVGGRWGVRAEYHCANTVPQREQAVVDGSSKWHFGQIV
jgi:hypothetical protein